MEPQYLLVVNHIISNLLSAVNELRQMPDFTNLSVLLITDRSNFKEQYLKHIDEDQVIFCDYGKPATIEKALAAYKKNIIGVVCRGDKHVQYLRKLVPYLPDGVKVSTADALKTATNKRLMRESFAETYPEITPNFIEVGDASLKTIQSIEERMDYPLIIKPANLFSSLLIQKCQDRAALESGLRSVFNKISETYATRGIHEPAQVIVEEFLEGDFYSIDAYVAAKNDVYFCPPVGYIPAEKLGINDFFLYKRFLPTELSKAEVESANEAVRKALTAVNLTYSSAHVELVLTKNGWKIIEIGPRLGRFRHRMYDLAYGINHSLNDIKIHLGLKPDIPVRFHRYCSAYSIYPLKEGKLRKISGLEELRQHPELKQIKIYKKPGDYCHFARNGGGPVTEFTIAAQHKGKYQELVNLIEEKVYGVID
jgi:D-alanine-D-alanine ligase-like ATP-grasp enzyme